MISASTGRYANTNWYFDYLGGPPTYILGYFMSSAAAQGVTSVNPSASIIGTTGTNSLYGWAIYNPSNQCRRLFYGWLGRWYWRYEFIRGWISQVLWNERMVYYDDG